VAHKDDSRGEERTLRTSCEEEVEEPYYYRQLLDAKHHRVEMVAEVDSILRRVAAADTNGAVPRAEADRELAASAAPKLTVPVAVAVASNPFAASFELAQQRPE
jgi:hypothetical protein